MPSLEQEFTQAMFDIYRRAKVEAGYNASIFFHDLGSGWGTHRESPNQCVSAIRGLYALVRARSP